MWVFRKQHALRYLWPCILRQLGTQASPPRSAAYTPKVSSGESVHTFQIMSWITTCIPMVRSICSLPLNGDMLGKLGKTVLSVMWYLWWFSKIDSCWIVPKKKKYKRFVYEQKTLCERYLQVYSDIEGASVLPRAFFFFQHHGCMCNDKLQSKQQVNFPVRLNFWSKSRMVFIC